MSHSRGFHVKASFLMTACAFLFLLGGCGGTKCEAVCASFNTCTVAERDHKVDCFNFCNNVESFQTRASQAGADNCATQFHAHLDCWQSNVAYICKADSDVCTATGTAWTDCLAKWCGVASNVSDPACVDQGDGTAVPAFGAF